MNLAFFSGNEVFWKTRYEPSIDGSNTSYRTLVSYKETRSNAKIDPTPTWTGTWRDPRFSPPSDGGRPRERADRHALAWSQTGQRRRSPVPAAEGKFRFWRNTSMATLARRHHGHPAAAASLGYEFDADVDNGFRPAGPVRPVLDHADREPELLDYGSHRRHRARPPTT